MKIYVKKIFILIITIILLFSGSPVFAKLDDGLRDGEGSIDYGDIDTDFYKPTELPSSEFSKFTEKIKMVLGVINVVGVVCSVIIICLIGLRYMLGSVEQKAEYKKTAIAYIIGAILISTSTTIPNMLYKLGSSIGQ